MLQQTKVVQELLENDSRKLDLSRASKTTSPAILITKSLNLNHEELIHVQIKDHLLKLLKQIRKKDNSASVEMQVKLPNSVNMPLKLPTDKQISLL